MTNDVRSQVQDVEHPRKTVRLTFRVVSGEVRLESHARLEMICPPSVGECPKAGHSGYWMELRDARGHVLFHRLLHAPLGNSVEVHSPDGNIRRVFGPPVDNIFEALVPDTPQAVSMVLMGESLDAETGFAIEGGAKELMCFDLPKGDTGDGRVRNECE